VATLQAYDAAADSWTLAAPLPLAVNHAMAASWGGKLYLIGGQTDANVAYSNRVQEYDPASNTWRDRAPMPTARSSGVAAVIEDKIYVAGGLNGIAAHGCLHIFGGEFATGVHPDHDVYDPVRDRWEKLPNLPIPVHGVTGAAFVGGLIYLPGGGTMQGGSSGSRLHQVYRPDRVCR
jgi:N-acetylneuraminic acid mutarotase